MWNFLKPAPHKDLLPEGKIDSTYKSLRWQVFVGIFIGYAGYYIVRKNFSMAMPFLTDPAGPYGFKKENYKTSQDIGESLFKQIEALDIDYVVTDCETCKWQIEMSTSKRCEHPISILANTLE